MRNVLILLVCCSAFLLSACNRYDSAVTSLPGTISGFVSIINESGSSLADKRGVRISLDGTNYSAISDSSGHWKLGDVQAGVYNIAFSKDSFGTNKVISYNFAGNGNAFIQQMQIAAIPKITSTNESVEVDTSSGTWSLKVKGSISQVAADSTIRIVLLFFGRDANVSSDPQKYVAASNSFVASGDNRFSPVIYLQQLHSMGFKSGEKVYLASYAASKQFFRYIDVNTSRNYYCGISDRRMNYVVFVVP